MTELNADVLIVGGGTGGVAAALAATAMGASVILTEPTDWVGGQLTSQLVPPDEHPWIEQFGCTARYRAYRDGVRAYYRDRMPLTAGARAERYLNPGRGWVSRLCHDPNIGAQVLNAMLRPAVASGRLRIFLRTIPGAASVDGDRVESVHFRGEEGREMVVTAPFVLDATELGDLLALTGTEYVVGAESRSETGEAHAVDGAAQTDNVQGITWCLALAHDDGSHRVIDRPFDYLRWRDYTPQNWPGRLLSFEVLDPPTGGKRDLPLFSDHWFQLFSYRQVLAPEIFVAESAPHPVTIVNWPQNDYFVETITDPVATGDPEYLRRTGDAKELSRCLLYWLQTEAPRHDGGVGYPGLYPRPDFTGTADGFALAPYIRESRRIRAEFTVLEQHVSVEGNPGRDRAAHFEDSVGIGAYRIDLHPATNGAPTIDMSSLPFQIPLGALIPVRVRNLVAAAKNIGVTHITNGCYRLHPVEWNIGEAAGALAAFCVQTGAEPSQVRETPDLLAEYQRSLVSQGAELDWPRLRAL